MIILKLICHLFGDQQSRFHLLTSDRFVMEDFDVKSPFSSFLPAVAGYFGKPVWAFYVNRGQVMSQFWSEGRIIIFIF